MRIKRWVIGGAVAIAVIGVLVVLTSQSEPKAPVVYLKRGAISESIQERGIFVSTEQQKVFSEISGQVSSIPVKEGQVVSQNQTVLHVNKTDINFKISQAVYKWKSETVEAENLARKIKQKRVLVKQNIIAIEEFQSLESNLAKLQLSIDARSEEIIHLKHKRKLHNVKSLVYGSVSAIFVDEEQMVQPGTLLMEIKNSNKLNIEVVIREYEAHKINVGQKVRIKSPIFPERVLQGTISMVVPSISDNQGSAGMKVGISIEDDIVPFNIQPGNQVDLEILLSHKDDCLYLPIGAVKRSQGTYYVVLEKGHKEKEVQVGVQDQNRIEILGGLDLNEGVIHAPLH